MSERGTARDFGWCALVVVMVVLTVANLAAGILSVATGHYGALLRAPFGVLFGYWVAVGAWRRTTWGLRTVGTALAGPTLDANWTRRLVLLAAVCPIALALAVAVQAVIGRS